MEYLGLHYESTKEALIEAFEASAMTDSETNREEAFFLGIGTASGHFFWCDSGGWKF